MSESFTYLGMTFKTKEDMEDYEKYCEISSWCQNQHHFNDFSNAQIEKIVDALVENGSELEGLL